MNLPSKYLDRAVEQLSSLPGIGKRTALRLALQLLKRDTAEIQAFSDAISDLKTHTKQCKICNNISDSEICAAEFYSLMMQLFVLFAPTRQGMQVSFVLWKTLET